MILMIMIDISCWLPRRGWRNGMAWKSSIPLSLFLSVSLFMYIYIYIYINRETERKRERGMLLFQAIPFRQPRRGSQQLISIIIISIISIGIASTSTRTIIQHIYIYILLSLISSLLLIIYL